MTLPIGSNLTLSCAAIGDPKPHFHWSKNGSRNIPRARYLENNSTLVIDKVEIADEGFYKCTVTNRVGNDSSSAKVEVQSKWILYHLFYSPLPVVVVVVVVVVAVAVVVVVVVVVVVAAAAAAIVIVLFFFLSLFLSLFRGVGGNILI